MVSHRSHLINLYISTFLKVNANINIVKKIYVIIFVCTFALSDHLFSHSLKDKFYLVCNITQGYDNLQKKFFDISFLPKQSYIIDQKNKKITSLNGYEYKTKTFTDEEISFSTHVLGWDNIWIISRVDGFLQQLRNTDTLNISPYLSYEGECAKKQNTSF